MRKRHSLQTYMHHIELISRLRHCHLVSALGHCFECYQDDSSVCRIFLIFEFVSNGTLRDYISGRVSFCCIFLPAIYIQEILDLVSIHIHPFFLSGLNPYSLDPLISNSKLSISLLNFPSVGYLNQKLSLPGLTGQKFTWTQRIGAAIGVVKGIQFLHTGIVPGLYSNNLKITDISFDHNLHAKIKTYNLPLLAENRGTV